MSVNAVMNSTSPVPAVASVAAHVPSPAEHRQVFDGSAGNEHTKQMIEEMQSHIDSMNVSLQYSTYGNEGEKLAITVVDKETGKVVREIPSKEIQQLYSKMSELAGLIFNKDI